MMPPTKILVVSDDNEMELTNAIPKHKDVKENFYVYKYTKSKTKMMLELFISEPELKKNLDRNIFKEIP